MMKRCRQRIEEDSTDQWAIDVLSRVEGCVDFVAVKSRYIQIAFFDSTKTKNHKRRVNQKEEGNHQTI